MADRFEMPADVCLHAEKVSKIYPGTKALDEVSFDVYKGKVNVLIGENGAGKSTLMKIIAGIEQESAGTLYMGGEKVSFKNVTEARVHGIGIIHQELSLFPNLNVYQNIFMSREQTRYRFGLDNKKHIELTKKIMDKLEHPISPQMIVGDLRVGQQQMIEIARNLVQDDLKILIMDEPTSSLSAQEVQVLFKIMRELTAEGISIVYISHRLEEIMQIGDYVTILRDGKFVAASAVKEIDISWIVKQMVGKGKVYPQRQERVDWEKREKVLVFTQFREMTEPLSEFLSEIFGKTGLVLHGGTNIKQRSEMVTAFNKDEHIPYMILSLKAGGVGLNLTAANHVIHFDRWWNPAVEDQATDRAFRIGQKKNVMVYKFVTKGTLEEKIDTVINSKKALASELLPKEREKWITEMDNEEIMNLFSLGGESDEPISTL